MTLPRHSRSAFATQLHIWLQAFVRGLFKLVLADIVCSFVAEWVIYFLIGRKLISKPHQGRGGGVKVIICGISRSGSTSLQYAMDILGFPCFHGVNLMKPSKCKLFMKAYKSGNKEDWDNLLEGYAAIADFPAAVCYKQLLELYPEAKVILNTRDPQKWYRSFSQTIMKSTQMVQLLRPSITHTCVNELVYEGMLKGKAEDKDFAVQMYKKHMEEVKAHVGSPSKLLVYEFGENTRGWAPLCEFLGVEVPQVPFPSSNDTQSFQNSIFYFATIHSFVVASYLALLSLTFAFLLKLAG